MLNKSRTKTCQKKKMDCKTYGAVVIVDVDDYVQEANRQLGNTESYIKLTIDINQISRI